MPSLPLAAAERLVPSQYPTLQVAIDAAASGDTIRLAPGDYYEQGTVIDKTLSITGDPGAILHAHNGMRNTPWDQNVAILAFQRSDVTVSNLALEGHRQGDSYGDRLRAIIFLGANGTLENCTIRGFRSTGPSLIRAVNVHNNVHNGIINVSVSGCSFSDNAWSLVLFGSDSTPGSLYTRFSVASNSFSGTPEASYQHMGIWISYGAGGSIVGNTLINHVHDEGYGSAAAIAAIDGQFDVRGFFLPLQPLTIASNTFSNNTAHMLVAMGSNSKITNNVFVATPVGGSHPAIYLSGANILVAHNNFADLPEAIRFFGSNDTPGNIPIGVAESAELKDNWFRAVPTPIRVGSGSTFSEEGTQTSDFRPSFHTIQKQPGAPFQTSIRAWHDQSLTIESSTDLLQWTPLQTREIKLPLSSFEHAPSTPYHFYRLAAPSGPLFSKRVVLEWVGNKEKGKRVSY